MVLATCSNAQRRDVSVRVKQEEQDSARLKLKETEGSSVSWAQKEEEVSRGG